jgi:hypothetical protein
LLALFPFREFGYEELDYWLRMSRLLKMKRMFNIVDLVLIKILIKLVRRSSTLHPKTIAWFELVLQNLAQFCKIVLLVAFSSYCLACLWFWFVQEVKNEKYSYSNYEDGVTLMLDRSPDR